MNSPQSMQPLVLNGDELNILARLESPAFEIVAFSDRSPAKITANEDSALAMTYGTDAVVVAVADGAGGLPAGQRASNTAVAALRNALEQAAVLEVIIIVVIDPHLEKTVGLQPEWLVNLEVKTHFRAMHMN